MTEDLSLFMAFAAGLLSFLSPCVLPLIPSYLSILGGVGLGAKTGATAAAQSTNGQRPDSYRSRLLLAAAGFVLGFSTVFITLGILISATFSLMGGIMTYINWAAGIIVIILGLNIIFDFISFLNYEKRPLFKGTLFQDQRLGAIPTAFIAGAAFATGWTPCIGPILTSILLMAGQSGETGTAVVFLAVYSSGLALPFLLVALFFDSFLKNAARFRSHLPLIRRVSGVLLIIIGIMILSGRYSALNILIQKMIFGYIDWAQTRAPPFRFLAQWLAWLQSF